jgi:hypothetical protein
MYLEKERAIEIYDCVDVLVAGGGTAGFAAAVAAARNGSRTLLIERNGVIGGVATAGLMISWGVKGRFWDGTGEQVITGIPWEFHKRIIEKGGSTKCALSRETAPFKAVFDIELFKRTALEMLVQAGVEILFHTAICATIHENHVVQGVIIENKSGRQAVFAKQVIDATGDGDICAGAGLEYSENTSVNSLMFRVGGVQLQETFDYMKKTRNLLKKPADDRYFNMYPWEVFEENWNHGLFWASCRGLDNLLGMEPFRFILEDAVSKGQITRDALNFMIEIDRGISREGSWGFDMQGIEGWTEKNYVNVWGMAAVFRGTNAKQVSEYEIKGYFQNWIFYESIIKKIPGFEHSWLLDVATEFGIRSSRKIKTDYAVSAADVEQGVVFADVVGRYAYDKFWNQNYINNPLRGFDIPYRQLLPVNAHNIYIVGKPHGGYLRAMTSCMVLGESAGIAAALAAEKNISSRAVNIHELQNRLLDNHINLGIISHSI